MDFARVCARAAAARCSRGGGAKGARASPCSANLPRMHMSKPRRLKTPHEFKRVLREGRRAGGRLLVCIALPSQGGDVRVGVSAGRGVGGAVQRNSAKRLLREAARAVLPQIKPGTDLVIVAKPALL